MKHPALARVFSIVLAIFSVFMLVNGSLGFGRASTSRQDSLDKYQRLEDKTSEYESLTAQLENTISYDEAYAALQELQSAHDSDASQHRTDLATYTATRGGYTMAVQLINDGKEELAEAKAELATGKKALEAQEEQFNQLVSIYDAAAPALKLAAENASDGELEYQAALYSLDLMLYQIDTLLGNETQLPELPTLPAEPEEDADEETKLAYAAEYAEYEAAYSEYEAAYSEYETAYEAWVQECAALESSIAADLPSVDSVIQSGNDLINAAIALIPENMLESLGNIIGGNIELGDVTDMSLPQLRGYLAQARSYLASSGSLSNAVNSLVNSLEAQVQQGKQAIATAKYQITVGEKALVTGEQEIQHQLEVIWYNLGQLDDETDELAATKTRLDDEADVIAKQLVSVEEQKSLEQKQSSARIILMKEEGIKSLVNDGGELPESARSYILDGRSSAEHSFMLMCIINALAVAGGVLGLLSVLGSFEKLKSRTMLIASTALCLACAVAAEALNISLNSAQMYTATFVIIAAALHLLVILPKNKA